jgi:hypothetical protein
MRSAPPGLSGMITVNSFHTPLRVPGLAAAACLVSIIVSIDWLGCQYFSCDP